MMTKPFDVSAVGYVKRVVIGNTDPEKTVNEEDIEKQRQLLNRCLSDSPRGRIIGQEKNFYLLNIGEHPAVSPKTVKRSSETAAAEAQIDLIIYFHFIFPPLKKAAHNRRLS